MARTARRTKVLARICHMAPARTSEQLAPPLPRRSQRTFQALVRTMCAQRQRASLVKKQKAAKVGFVQPVSASLLLSQAPCVQRKPLVEAPSLASMASARIPQDQTAQAPVDVKAAFALARALAALAFLALPPSAPFAPRAPLAATAFQVHVLPSQPRPGLFPSLSLWAF